MVLVLFKSGLLPLHTVDNDDGFLFQSSLSASFQTLFRSSSEKVESLSSRITLNPNDETKLDDKGVIGRVYFEGATDIQYKCIRVSEASKRWYF